MSIKSQNKHFFDHFAHSSFFTKKLKKIFFDFFGHFSGPDVVLETSSIFSNQFEILGPIGLLITHPKLKFVLSLQKNEFEKKI
jgi:hypothetical protein